MNLMQAVSVGFRDYFKFGGRSIRSEYWYWTLFTIIIGVILTVIDFMFFPNNSIQPLSTIFDVLTIIPSIAVSMRRLHDIGRTGLWLLLACTVIGIAVLIYWFCLRGTVGENQYGDDPLAGA
jgi:uncharacterized membrane protein YhaH (DUF805 family)